MSSALPHIPTANTCQYCDKHLRVIHSTTPRCDRCLPDETTKLKTCSCHLVRYCNAECQKNDWETHQVACRTARTNTEVARMLGSEARHLSFVDWCKHSRDQFSFPALWALEAGTEADMTETHIFVIYIDVDEEISTSGKSRFKRRIRTAKCVSEAELSQEFAARYSQWKVPPAAPLWARIWLVDDGLPYGLESVEQMAEIVNIDKLRSQVFPGMQCDWLALLEDSVSIGAPMPPGEYVYRAGSSRTMDEMRSTHIEKLKALYGEQFGMAAYSALDITQHSNRIVTHCLVLHMDMEQNHQGAVVKTAIRSAKMASLSDLRALFHADLFGQGSLDMRTILFSRPNVLRTLIIDDALSAGRNIQVVALDMSRVSNPRTLYTYHPDWLPRLKRLVEK
ncbi:hypothetical protein K438DRAFT_2007040 [Mycena galopus ATCC 62051]|nr:hypothetical protein K438DRAFT_2007040 [Mycena galopus ATCC 62051]